MKYLSTIIPEAIPGWEVEDEAVQPWKPEARIVRKLGCVESYQIALQRLDYMRGNIIGFQYKIPSRISTRDSEQALIDTFERAVACAVLKHPHMQVGIVGEDTDQPCFVRLDSIDLSNHVEWYVVRGDTEDISKVFRARTNQHLDEKFINFQAVPGWKIKVLRQEGAECMEVSLVFNHTTMDGGGAKAFHSDLLESLRQHSQPIKNNLQLHGHILTIPFNSVAKLTPPAERLVDFPVDSAALEWYLANEVNISSSQYPRALPTQAHWAPIAPSPAPFKTQFRTITVSPDVLSELLAACRQQKTTLTGLLHSLIFVSLSPLLDSTIAPAFEFMTAMDLRRFLPSTPKEYPWFVPSKAMNNYVTIQNHVFDQELTSEMRDKAAACAAPPECLETGELMQLIWTCARRVKDELDAKIERGVYNDMNGFAQAVTDWRAQLQEEAKRPRKTGWVITNIGAFDGRSVTEDDWEITQAHFIMCANVVASAFQISIAAAKGGNLMVSCSWQDCVVEEKLGEGLVGNLERWLGFTARHRDGCPVPDKE
ncbi:alcohol acetyltransferase [Apiosordaria backusii]|uniref:Alcohol acetyltransferase n=1 Tax=Apiosordaria backusii TaxID=314023 RepID=A0AA40B267_9PEZI|nr:alcohol acetyltransferase [Apiosordaria backusii]